MNQLPRNISSVEVAEMVGRQHKDVMRDIRIILEQLDELKIAPISYFIESTYKDDLNRTKPCYLLSKQGCELYGNRMTGVDGTAFSVKYIERFNDMENLFKQASSSSNAVDFEKQLIGVKYATEILRVDEPSKIRMLTEAHKQHGVPTSHLPDYVDEELKKSLTELLKEHGVTMRTAKANTRLIELGILEIKERPSSKGGTKEFKSLTEAGRKYGDNAISPYNSKETQPLYYPSKFSELLGLLLEKEVS